MHAIMINVGSDSNDVKV